MYPEDLKYNKTHEWVKVEENRAKIGISGFAISELTDLTFLDIQVEEGNEINKGDCFGEVESVKATEDMYSPLSGKIIAINSELSEMLDEMMESPYEIGWIIEIELTNNEELDSLMSAEDYKKFVEESDH